MIHQQLIFIVSLKQSRYFHRKFTKNMKMLRTENESNGSWMQQSNILKKQQRSKKSKSESRQLRQTLK